MSNLVHYMLGRNLRSTRVHFYTRLPYYHWPHCGAAASSFSSTRLFILRWTKISSLDQLMTDFPRYQCPALVFGQWTLAPPCSVCPPNPSPNLCLPRLTRSLCPHALVLSTKTVWKHNIYKRNKWRLSDVFLKYWCLTLLISGYRMSRFHGVKVLLGTDIWI